MTGRRNSNLGVFLQDDWKLTERVTVNLGLRYDRQLGSYNEDLSQLLGDIGDKLGPLLFQFTPMRLGGARSEREFLAQLARFLAAAGHPVGPRRTPHGHESPVQWLEARATSSAMPSLAL